MKGLATCCSKENNYWEFHIKAKIVEATPMTYSNPSWILNSLIFF